MTGERMYSDQELYVTFLRSSFDFYNNLNTDLKRGYSIFVADVREFLHNDETVSPAFTKEINSYLFFDNKNKYFLNENINYAVMDHLNAPRKFFDFHKNLIADHTKNHLFQAVKLLRYFNVVDIPETKERGEFVSSLNDMIKNVTSTLLEGAKRYTETKLKYFEFQNRFSGSKVENLTSDKGSYSPLYAPSYKSQLAEFQKLNQVMVNVLSIFGNLNNAIEENMNTESDLKLHDKVKELSVDLEKTNTHLKENFETFIQVSNYFQLVKSRSKVSDRAELVLSSTNLSLLGDSKIAVDSVMPDFKRQYSKIINLLEADQQFEALSVIKNANKENIIRLKLDIKDVSDMVSQVSPGRF
jgi:hypothetical protein